VCNNCFIIHWTEKNGSHVFASSLTVGNIKRATLTWLPLEIMHRGHTWHDHPWPWVSLTWLLYNLKLWRHGRWFRKFTVRFRPIRKEIVRSMYNNHRNQRVLFIYHISAQACLCVWHAYGVRMYVAHAHVCGTCACVVLVRLCVQDVTRAHVIKVAVSHWTWKMNCGRFMSVQSPATP